jgi:hypothetical protein
LDLDLIIEMEVRVLRSAFAQWAGRHWEMKAREARKEIDEQRAVMTAQAKIISMLWERPTLHTDDIVADYSSLRANAHV